MPFDAFHHLLYKGTMQKCTFPLQNDGAGAIASLFALEFHIIGHRLSRGIKLTMATIIFYITDFLHLKLNCDASEIGVCDIGNVISRFHCNKNRVIK